MKSLEIMAKDLRAALAVVEAALTNNKTVDTPGPIPRILVDSKMRYHICTETMYSLDCFVDVVGNTAYGVTSVLHNGERFVLTDVENELDGDSLTIRCYENVALDDSTYAATVSKESIDCAKGTGLPL